MDMARYAEQSFNKAQGVFGRTNWVMPTASDDVKRWLENIVFRLKSLDEGMLNISVGGTQISKAIEQLDDKLNEIKRKLGIP